jgi:hypothetical protein
MNPTLGWTESPGRLAGRPLAEWNAAHARVEAYFSSLRIRNKVLLGQLVALVIERAMRRAPTAPNLAATQLAAEEMDHVVTEWFAEVLQEPPLGRDHMLSTRGRLALLLADMPGKWQDQFLRPGPWPGEFLKAMRDAYLRAGPDFQLSQMEPRPLDLGPIAKLTSIAKVRYSKMIGIWLFFALVLATVFILTHR